MRRLRLTLALATILVCLAAPAATSAHGGHRHGSGFVSPHARVHGHSQLSLISAWGRWVFGTPFEDNDALNGRCAPHPRDPKIWFLPVSIAEGDLTISCKVPQGAYLMLSPGGYECSQTEGNGTTKAELRACARAGFEQIVETTVTFRGRTYTDLSRYVKTSRVYQLPSPNLYGDEGGPSLVKGYFIFIKPMKVGHHTISDTILFSDGFGGELTYDIEVVPRHHQH